jgi:NADH-quinone oxidoreductase subunit L
MMLGCGVGAYAAGIFHLFTHAFFKSLLFLAAGSIIQALRGEQDIRKMGGLRRRLPRTYPCFLVGALALAGLPFLSGFFSKDAILAAAFARGRYDLWAVGLFGAALTAFYMFRLVFMVFYGRERGGFRDGAAIHESPAIMTTPLLILAGLSVAAGFLGLPAVFGARADLFGRFLAPALPPTAADHLSGGMGAGLLILSAALALAGVFAARLFYLRKPSWPGIVAARFPAVYRLLSGKFYFDEAYEALFVRPAIRGGAAVFRGFDLKVIDGGLSGAAAVADRGGRVLAAAQTGFIKDYVLAFLAGAVIFLGALLW